MARRKRRPSSVRAAQATHTLLEQMIRQTLVAATKQGWKLAPGKILDRANKRCCLIGAYGLTRGRKTEKDMIAVMRSELGLSHATIADLADGFDGVKSMQGCNRHFYKLGQALAKEFLRK